MASRALLPPGDPRDLISLSNLGVAQTMVEFSSYLQLRDFADITVSGTLSDIRVTAPYAAPYVTAGDLTMTLTVERVFGGRFTSISPGQEVTIVLPMSAPEHLVPVLLPKLKRLERSNRFLFFLQQRVGPTETPGVARFAPIFYGAPPAVLAEWPGDGRLTDLQPHAYLARMAVARGEALTGTTSQPLPDWKPTFRGDPPIGLTLGEAARSFTGIPGRPAVAPPLGWERLEPILASPPG